MGTALIVAGGVLQIVGLGFVFAELALIRSYEFGVPAPWTRLAGRLRRLLRRPRVIEAAGASMLGSFHVSGRGIVRPGPLKRDATDAERIERLERYVERIDEDLKGVHASIERTAREQQEAARRADDELRGELKQRDEQRRLALRSSLRRQLAGGICISIGLVLATIGSVA